MINLVLVEEIFNPNNNKRDLCKIFSIFENLEIFDSFKMYLK